MAVKKRGFYRILAVFLGLFLLAGSFNLAAPMVALAEPTDSLEISGDGVTNPTTFTLAELQAMDQHQRVYSAINTWPTKKWYVGKGVKLTYLLEQAGIKEDAQLLKFISSDGYAVTLTVKELLKDKRYCFPHFKDNSAGDGDGNIPGSSANARLVEPIIGLVSVEGSDNPKYMSDLNSLLLMMGQRAVTEQNGNLFVKYLSKIEVLTTEPPQWDTPQANPESGVVPAGTMVALSNAHMDDDKVYYTTDGTTPTVNSTMYNWIAKRWWSSRADEVGIYNHPIGPINESTTIKAITIGPGKRDSDVVAFTYTVPGTEPDEKVPEEADVTTDTGVPGMEGDDTTEPVVDLPQEPEKPIPQVVNLTDIQGHWAEKNIRELVADGTVGGYPDATFKPDNTITRGEFATMLVKAFQLENGAGKVFADTKDHWAKDYIARATSHGVVSGYDADTFGPNNLITREQMAVMIARTVQLASLAEELLFADSSRISQWAKEAMAGVTKKGIMKGYPDNTVNPQGNATRAEAITLIANARNN
ncbi:S-layer homology domain-containing protein [Syntrophomonas erecta]